MIYGLSRKGVRLLNGYQRGELDGDHSERNRRAGSIFIQHTAETASFMTRLEVACRGREGVSLLMRDEIIAAAPEATRQAREPLRLRGTVKEPGKKLAVSVIPDELFGLVFPDDTASYFWFENDRGTMPVMRRGAFTAARRDYGASGA
jgi:Replication-relaxation